MTKDEAVKIIESLVIACLGQGAFKNYETLDNVREAMEVLKGEK